MRLWPSGLAGTPIVPAYGFNSVAACELDDMRCPNRMAQMAKFIKGRGLLSSVTLQRETEEAWQDDLYGHEREPCPSTKAAEFLSEHQISMEELVAFWYAGPAAKYAQGQLEGTRAHGELLMKFLGLPPTPPGYEGDIWKRTELARRNEPPRWILMLLSLIHI